MTQDDQSGPNAASAPEPAPADPLPAEPRAPGAPGPGLAGAGTMGANGANADLLPCRACRGALSLVLDLGRHPLAGSFPAADDDPALEPTWPLRLARCPACGLVQLGDPSPDEPDVSGGPVTSVSPTLAAHARAFVDDVVARGFVPAGALVVTTASHGNHLARFFAERGIDAVIAEEGDSAARAFGVAGWRAVHGGPVNPARALAQIGQQAQVVVDHFLLAHLSDPVAALDGYRRLVATGGAVVLEFDHWLPTFTGRQWDAIRHGHVTYLTAGWLVPALGRAGFVVEDGVPQDVYGGSLRIVARAVEQGRVRAGSAQAGSVTVQPGGPGGTVDGGARSSGDADGPGRIAAILAAEAAAGLDDPRALASFEADVRAAIAAARVYLATGRQIAAYGAPARGNTFLNAVGPGARRIAYAVDASPAKQGRVLPGTRIPIRAPQALRDGPVDDVLVLPWDLAPEIAGQLADVRAAGARLLVGVPELRVLDAAGVPAGVPGEPPAEPPREPPAEAPGEARGEAPRQPPGEVPE